MLVLLKYLAGFIFLASWVYFVLLDRKGNIPKVPSEPVSSDKEELIKLKLHLEEQNIVNKELRKEITNLQEEVGKEREANRVLLSQKKSSESRLGGVVEVLVPFLEGCPYDPRDLHFIGAPFDYLCVDFDQGELTVIEIKSNKSRPSKRQKTIKNIIKAGRVYYAEIRVDGKGVKHKRYDNLIPAENLKEEESLED